ncbi:hypothetical protein K2Z83_21085 [Oscillochloris sp. ZM17-4]|uniref:hypothetical protein n=1 Tax=Oscillochloris sp. ZM17-4 TaxID=2866714 RepID=UPI001C732693|nr:hypothetical protein [Oscillochloris sp. ZM17-4]MBX0330167.1 hypothetical protein [Oscillochloris sp. ZM17-4]
MFHIRRFIEPCAAAQRPNDPPHKRRHTWGDEGGGAHTAPRRPWYDGPMEKSNSGGAAMSEGGRGGVADLIAELASELGRPPEGCGRAMALVVGLGGADHLGLLVGGRPSPGGLDLLASVIPSRARPQATLLLEWVSAGERRRYLGWAVEFEATRFIWRRMSAEDLRAVADPRTRRPLGEEAGATFEG